MLITGWGGEYRGSVRTACRLTAVVLLAAAASCGPRRAAVIGPIADPAATARGLEGATRLEEPMRIDFSWRLNESGSRLAGVGVARIEPPYRARLDLFLDNGEGVVSAALVGDELRLPYGSREDILPPVDLMWGTLGVFRPVAGAELVAGERLEGQASRLRYRQRDGTELHYEVSRASLSAVELMDDDHVLEWVRVTGSDGSRYPEQATYRNLVAYRELRISRTSMRPAEPFDPDIWDPR